MYPAKFDYHAPTSLDAAISLLRAHEDAKVLAGGHSLIPIMKQRMAQPGTLISLAKVAELTGIRETATHIVVGAMTRHADVARSPILAKRMPIIAETAAQIGDQQVRNRGTMGGSLVHADPGADYPGLVLALDAELVCRGPDGERTVRAQDWFVDIMTTTIEPDEILTEVRFAIPGRKPYGAYRKYRHPASGLCHAGVVVVLDLDEVGVVAGARLAVNGVADCAFRATEAEDYLVGKDLSPEVIAQAVSLVCEQAEINGDHFSSADHRRDILGEQARLAFADILDRRDRS